MTNEKLLAKIQKLISLSESPNENEAKAAMAKAQELMLKHNIDMRQVQNHDDEYINEQSETFKRMSPEMKFINDILESFFFVKIVTSKRHDFNGSYQYFNYIGEKQNVATAIHMKNFLKATFQRLWKEYKKETGATTRSKQSFIYGVYKGFKAKLEEQRMEAEQQYGLVLVEDPRATEKMHELFKNLRSSRASSMNLRDGAAMNAGVAQGRKLRVSAGAIA